LEQILGIPAQIGGPLLLAAPDNHAGKPEDIEIVSIRSFLMETICHFDAMNVRRER
jgi:hypothetical protein